MCSSKGTYISKCGWTGAQRAPITDFCGSNTVYSEKTGKCEAVCSMNGIQSLSSKIPTDTILEVVQDTEIPKEMIRKAVQDTEIPKEMIRKVVQDTKIPKEIIRKVVQDTKVMTEAIPEVVNISKIATKTDDLSKMAAILIQSNTQ